MAKSDEATGYGFGTFKGVFTPSILTIFGVIMYLRFGWVLGNLGLPLTLLTVTMACAITFVTGLSLSAIATNMKIGGGGAYYIISRALGPEAGAAIGVPLFLAQSLGVAFYISGFSEALAGTVDLTVYTNLLPFALSPERLIAIVTLTVLVVLTAISADWALRTQYLIMAVIGASLFSFFAGALSAEVGVLAAEAVPVKRSFWLVFAVFFPAVTGIEAGISMSGDLKDPAKSLPRGTLSAVLVGYVVYMAIPFFLSYAVRDPNVLLTQPLIMREIARWGGLVLAGVWLAALSSALGALLGAPRTLQALARDRVIPGFIGRGYGVNNDPRIAAVLSFAVALIAVLAGDLDVIAPVLSMFFLTSYGLINLSAGLECVIGSPSWRPVFRIRPELAFLGAGGCFAVMFMIDPGATFLAWGLTSGIYLLMKRRNLQTQWGDMRYGVLMLMARFAIVRLMKRRVDTRGWRPNILAFSGSPESRWYLVEMAQALARGPACLTLATVVPTRAWSAERVLQLQDSMADYLAKRKVDALVKVFPADDVLEGVVGLVKGYGFGPIVPNTIMLGESDLDRNIDRMVALIQLLHHLRRNLIQLFEVEGPPADAAHRRIDIWWRGGEENIGLILTLAYLLQLNEGWQGTVIVIKRIVDSTDQNRDEVKRNLEAYVAGLRMPVDVEIMEREGREVFDIIHVSSSDAALVLMGLRSPGDDESDSDYAAYYRTLVEKTDGLPLALVLAAERIEFKQLIGLQ